MELTRFTFDFNEENIDKISDDTQIGSKTSLS